MSVSPLSIIPQRLREGSLFDNVVRGVFGVNDPAENFREAFSPSFERLKTAVVIDATNVVEYFHEVNDKGSWELDRDFPALIPPFPEMFIETRCPRFSRTPDSITPWDPRGHGERWGAYFETSDFASLSAEEHTAEAAELFAIYQKMDGREYRQLLELPRFVTSIYPFVHFKSDRVVWGPPCAMFLFVGADGVAMRDDQGELIFWVFGFTSTEERVAQFIGMQHAWLDGLFLTISFMNCKNVRRQEQWPKRHKLRAAERRGDPKPTKYYTLEISPLKESLRTQGGIAQNGLSKALHICRGHFSHYTDEKPLFGKYAGRFWIPSHVRGSANVGIVSKDYAVTASREGRT